MFIGHLPAGYVLTKYLQKYFKTSNFLLIGLFGSIVPDIDILYFYLIDHRQNLHHGYWIHIPFYWLIIAAITLAVLWLLKKNRALIAAVIFFSNIFLHLFLDTIVGKIEWLFPFTNKAYYMFDVPAVRSFWVCNFVFHWTFLLEIGAVIWAIFVFIDSKKGKTPETADNIVQIG